ncbi:DUF4192 family protein [Auritidibacter ignavus]|uniref:DUF4192 family protein n=1 Tax=Auritidibacter ignavus TaxID=678932 RepID=UPI000F02B0EC|nr:DUF4192 family protein [Auritidibacter ignavus]NIH70400.1 hypothetical protein [Auritidibacter ignavus]RMX23637.1 DUF4192 family protein [Auritidibacter ignavus]WGH82320.1 DUF4192 family protein [Auritidibacter ignavus]
MTENNQHSVALGTTDSTPPVRSQGPRQFLARTEEDVLAFVQNTLGFVPQRSCVLISTCGSSFRAVLRVDLPALDDPVGEDEFPISTGFFDRVATTLRTDPKADGCFMLLQSEDDTVGDPGPVDRLAGYRRFAANLQEHLRHHQLPAQEVWVLSPHRVWHLDCAHGAECPVQGATLDATENSFLDLSMRADGVDTPRGPNDLVLPFNTQRLAEQLETWPAMDPTQRHQVAEANTPEQIRALYADLQAWDRLLSGETLPQSLESTEWCDLVRGLGEDRYRDMVLNIACFGLEPALAGAIHLGLIPQGYADEFDVIPTATSGTQFSQAFIGASDTVADWTRIQRFEDCARYAMSIYDGPEVLVLGIYLVYIEWVRGRGSIAANYHRQLQHAGGDGYELLNLLGKTLDRGMVCDWAKDAQRAWSSSGRT